MRHAILLLFSLTLVGAARTWAQEPVGPIQDNSFLIEEAYNQEPGVIQHISSFIRTWDGDWAYSFTQEWPVPGLKHQLSYTMQGVSVDGSRGLGDTLINYRYQLVGSGETRVAVAPRISLIIPTGDAHMSRGSGGTGFQTELPVSVVVNKHLVTHFNAGGSVIPHATNAEGDCARFTGVNLGQSFIWLASQRVNPMLETLWTSTDKIVGPGKTSREQDIYISPGVRWAYNFKSGLQIVPGVAFPIGVGPSAGQKSVLLYLSFEHPLFAPKKSGQE